MTIIAKLPYVKVIRQVKSVGKIEWEDQRIIYLFEEKITTAFREFPLEEVLDLSHRKIGEEGGFLFIHTNHGVYSYTLKTSPEYFINAFKALKNS